MDLDSFDNRVHKAIEFRLTRKIPNVKDVIATNVTASVVDLDLQRNVVVGRAVEEPCVNMCPWQASLDAHSEVGSARARSILHDFAS